MAKSIEEILDIDGSDGSFDDDEIRKSKERQAEREAEAKRLKEKVKNLKKKGNEEEYKREMLKLLGEESMEVLIHMKHEIEDDPTARGVECYATVVTAIANTVSELEKIDNNSRKNDVDLKKLAVNNNQPGLVHGNNNVVMVGSTNDLLDMLEEGGVIGNKKPPKVLDADAEVVETTEENPVDDTENTTNSDSVE